MSLNVLYLVALGLFVLTMFDEFLEKRRKHKEAMAWLDYQKHQQNTFDIRKL